MKIEAIIFYILQVLFVLLEAYVAFLLLKYLEMEALTTYPFTSIIKQCPPDPQTGLIDANRVAKFMGKRRKLRINYFQTATHSEKQAMEKKEHQKYTEYRGERTIPNMPNE